MQSRSVQVRGSRGIRLWAGSTLVMGAVGLIAPTPLIRALNSRARPSATRIVRVLGARQVVQGTAVLAAPQDRLVAAGTVVDALHGASMIGLALIAPGYRRPALVSALLAGLSAGVGAALFTRPA